MTAPQIRKILRFSQNHSFFSAIYVAYRAAFPCNEGIDHSPQQT